MSEVNLGADGYSGHPLCLMGDTESFLDMKYETLHWCVFNIGARLFGFMATFAALAFGLTAVLQGSGANLPTPGVSPLGNFFVSLICLALAVAILTRRPYRPDLPQENMDKSDKLPAVGWWTGTPKD
ncbi:MAG: hypothetical protein FP821_06630 [Sideroxydans sp.]|nr:hypothetical protein [Sideroxydans sp.]